MKILTNKKYQAIMERLQRTCEAQDNCIKEIELLKIENENLVVKGKNKDKEIEQLKQDILKTEDLLQTKKITLKNLKEINEKNRNEITELSNKVAKQYNTIKQQNEKNQILEKEIEALKNNVRNVFTNIVNDETAEQQIPKKKVKKVTANKNSKKEKTSKEETISKKEVEITKKVSKRGSKNE